MLELLRLAVALAGSAAAGWWDLKTTDIPDRLVFGMIGAGLLLNFLEWQLFGMQEIFIASALTTAAFGLFALFMYKVGAWGGGDGALLAAVGSLLPAWPVATGLDLLPFPLVYFVSVFLVGLFYSACYSLVVVWKSEMKNQFICSLQKCFWIIALFGALGALMLFLQPNVFSALLFVLLLMLVPVWKLSDFAKRAFHARISSNALKAGDMLGEDLPQLKLWARELRGLTKTEVAKIRKTKKVILVRSGVRYGPVFFLALLFVLLSSFLFI